MDNSNSAASDPLPVAPDWLLSICDRASLLQADRDRVCLYWKQEQDAEHDQSARDSVERFAQAIKIKQSGKRAKRSKARASRSKLQEDWRI